MSTNRLARDLARWGRQLSESNTRANWDDVVAWEANRTTALHLMIDVRRDVEATVGGRTLDSGKGRRARGYRAGVWASSLRDGPDWWTGGVGKLHWVDQGTAPHTIGDKGRRVGRRRRKNLAALLALPTGVITGPLHHPGARGTGLYGRSVASHATAAMDAGGAVVQDQVMRIVSGDA